MHTSATSGSMTSYIEWFRRGPNDHRVYRASASVQTDARNAAEALYSSKPRELRLDCTSPWQQSICCCARVEQQSNDSTTLDLSKLFGVDGRRVPSTVKSTVRRNSFGSPKRLAQMSPSESGSGRSAARFSACRARRVRCSAELALHTER